MGHLHGEWDGESTVSESGLKVTQAMMQKGAYRLLFFDPERSDYAECAKQIYLAMAEVSDSEP